MPSAIPLSVPDLGGHEADAVAACVRSTWVSSAGPEVTAFEARIAKLCGRDHGIAMVNGTAALHLALVAAGVGADHLVIVPDWTFAATANAVRHAGATPLFVDVTAESWTLDPALVEDVLSGPLGGRVAAVVPVHALGHPADMDPLVSLCARHGVPLIEDAAGAIGADYRGRSVGSFGHMAMFSFNGNKTITTGGGGMIVTDSADTADAVRSLSVQARSSTAYRYDAVGWNYRMPNLNAALGLAQLDRLAVILDMKAAIAGRYDAALAGRDDLQLMPRCPWGGSSHWLYSVRCASPADAAALVRHLEGAGIQARVFWEALSSQAPYAQAPRLLTGVAAALSGTVVSLPSSSTLTETETGMVVDAVAHWRGRRIGENCPPRPAL